MAIKSIEVKISKELLRELSLLNKYFRTKNLLNAIGARQLRWINENFKSRGRGWTGTENYPTGEKWRPLANITIQNRRKKSDVPLQDTGQLKNSFRYRITGVAAIVGSNLDYASLHQYGGRFKKTNAKVPARPMLPTKAIAQKIATDIVTGLIKKAKNG